MIHNFRLKSAEEQVEDLTTQVAELKRRAVGYREQIAGLERFVEKYRALVKDLRQELVGKTKEVLDMMTRTEEYGRKSRERP